MTALKCEMCTAALQVKPGQQIITCEFCGTSKVKPNAVPAPAPAPIHAPAANMGEVKHEPLTPGFSRKFWKPFPRQNPAVHILLLLPTIGIGNLIYFLYIKHKQRRWHEMRSNIMR
ncbi:MAG: hypothetical protein FWC77_07495 [Defluviitaleaceae bacterium]|nr:hypothetical protein [Defluviitaleaceae bacterium]